MKLTIPYQRNPYVRNVIHADTDDPDKFAIETTEEVDQLLDFCKAKREAVANAPDGLVHVAEVPLSIAERAEIEGWDQADWRRWLNDPDNAGFRTWKGRV